MISITPGRDRDGHNRGTLASLPAQSLDAGSNRLRDAVVSLATSAKAGPLLSETAILFAFLLPANIREQLLIAVSPPVPRQWGRDPVIGGPIILADRKPGRAWQTVATPA